jgi:hypothetical protein
VDEQPLKHIWEYNCGTCYDKGWAYQRVLGTRGSWSQRIAESRKEAQPCQSCGPCDFCSKPHSPIVTDPYIAEIDGEYVMRPLCNTCFEQRADDI